MTEIDIAKLRERLNGSHAQCVASITAGEVSALIDRLEAAEREIDRLHDEDRKTRNAMGERFTLVPPDGGDVKTWEAAEKMHATLEEAERERDEARSLCETLKMHASCHAMEARGANATIHEAYQAVTGATGEPGNWNGARPIKEALAAERSRAELAESRLVKAQTDIEALRSARATAEQDGFDAVLAERDKLRAMESRVAILEQALAKARAWHESEDKALSKSGRADAEYYWRRDRHYEQLQEIKRVLSEEQYDAAWDAMNAASDNRPDE